MNLIPIQSDFSIGELTPLMHSRSDSEIYNSALFKLLNMVPDAHGPAVSRSGMEWLVRVSGATDGRVHVFEVSKDEFWILVFDGTNMYTFDDTGTPNGVASTAVPWAQADLKDLQFIPDPNGILITVVHPSALPWEIAYNPATTDVTIAVSAYTAPPAAWAANKYPSCGCVYESRLWLAFGTTVWATRNDNRQNFTQGVAAVDGFEFTRDQYGNVAWMDGTGDLLMGTETGEYEISSQGTVIYIGDISVDRQSGYGSKNIQPKQLGDKIGYITVDGKKLNAMQYDDNTSKILSDDLTFLSEHITADEIKDFTWQQHPSAIAWFTDLVGNFLCLTYNRSINVFGWGRHNTQGTLLSLASGSLGGVSKVVALVERNGADLDVEIFNPAQLLDSYVSVVVAGPSTIVSGLTHLEGQTVKVIVDGALHPDRVVSSGAITLQYEVTGATVIVGLGFNQEFKTLPLDKGSQKGSGRAHLKKWKDIFVDLIESGMPQINGQTPADRYDATPMGSPEDPITGLVKVNDLDYTTQAYVEVIQSEPLPLKIAGVYGEFSQEKA